MKVASTVGRHERFDRLQRELIARDGLKNAVGVGALEIEITRHIASQLDSRAGIL